MVRLCLEEEQSLFSSFKFSSFSLFKFFVVFFCSSSFSSSFSSLFSSSFFVVLDGDDDGGGVLRGESSCCCCCACCVNCSWLSCNFFCDSRMAPISIFRLLVKGGCVCDMFVVGTFSIEIELSSSFSSSSIGVDIVEDTATVSDKVDVSMLLSLFSLDNIEEDMSCCCCGCEMMVEGEFGLWLLLFV